MTSHEPRRCTGRRGWKTVLHFRAGRAAYHRALHREGDIMQIAFIGAGKMGLPMARHLAAAGHAVTVADSAASAQAAARAAGLALAASIEEAVAAAEVVFSSLPNDDALLAVAPQVAAHARRDAVYADTSTVSLTASAEAAAACAARGIAHVRATV